MRDFRTFRVDANQSVIVKTFRQFGYAVAHTHQAGEGFPDIVVAKNGLNVLVEVKDGDRTPSARMLKPKQRKFLFLWPGMACVITKPEEVIEFDKEFKKIADKMKDAGIVPKAIGCNDPIYHPCLV